MNSIDYVPRPDVDFNIWQLALITMAQANAAAWGITAADITAMLAPQASWNATFAKSSNKQNRTSADVQAKDDARVIFEKALRKFIAQWLASNTKVADSDRQRMGLTVKSNKRTAVAIPSTSPVGIINFSTRMQHSINFSDEASPRSKAKPEGIHGCEVWVKLGGEVPKSPSELSFLATDTATPYVVNFSGDDIGKMAYYMLRWVNTRGERGPWSSTISAIVN